MTELRGGPDLRPRCEIDGKVLFTKEQAKLSAKAIRKRGVDMNAYKGKCGHWHVGHKPKKKCRNSNLQKAVAQ